VKGYVASRTAPNEFAWSNAIMGNMPWWVLWALLAPLIYRLTDRWPLVEGRIRRNASRHLAVSVVLSLAHLTFTALIVWAANVRDLMPYGALARSFLTGYLIPDILTYWLIAVAYSAYHWREALRLAERERHDSELRAARAETQAALLEGQANEARLAALRLELNPHFLFNALNSVAALARSGDSARATMVLARLSELLRETLDSDGDGLVPLAEELRLVSKYLEIQRVRFGERLRVDIDASPSVEQALLPPFSIQPLVENAIQHGVGSVRGPVSLSIRAVANGPDLVVTVSDSGGSLPEPDRLSERVGLGNTKARLRTLYGDRGRVQLRTTPEGSTEVRLSIPLEIERGVRV
jgi:two-component sensor histidine kinase